MGLELNLYSIIYMDQQYDQQYQQYDQQEEQYNEHFLQREEARLARRAEQLLQTYIADEKDTMKLLRTNTGIPDYYERETILGHNWENTKVFDTINQEDVPIGDFIDEDYDHIVFMMQKDGDTPKPFFATRRSLILQNTPRYQCTHRNSAREFDENEVYLSLAGMGCPCVAAVRYIAMITMLSTSYQIFVLRPPESPPMRTKTLMSHEVRYFSATHIGNPHCQDGTELDIYSIYVPPHLINTINHMILTINLKKRINHRPIGPAPGWWVYDISTLGTYTTVMDEWKKANVGNISDKIIHLFLNKFTLPSVRQWFVYYAKPLFLYTLPGWAHDPDDDNFYGTKALFIDILENTNNPHRVQLKPYYDNPLAIRTSTTLNLLFPDIKDIFVFKPPKVCSLDPDSYQAWMAYTGVKCMEFRWGIREVLRCIYLINSVWDRRQHWRGKKDLQSLVYAALYLVGVVNGKNAKLEPNVNRVGKTISLETLSKSSRPTGEPKPKYSVPEILQVAADICSIQPRELYMDLNEHLIPGDMRQLHIYTKEFLTEGIKVFKRPLPSDLPNPRNMSTLKNNLFPISRQCNNPDTIMGSSTSDIPPEKLYISPSGNCFDVSEDLFGHLMAGQVNDPYSGVPLWTNRDELTELLSHPGWSPEEREQLTIQLTQPVSARAIKAIAAHPEVLNKFWSLGPTLYTDYTDDFTLSLDAIGHALEWFESEISRHPEVRAILEIRELQAGNSMNIMEILRDAPNTCIHGIGFRIMHLYLDIWHALPKEARPPLPIAISTLHLGRNIWLGPEADYVKIFVIPDTEDETMYNIWYYIYDWKDNGHDSVMTDIGYVTGKNFDIFPHMPRSEYMRPIFDKVTKFYKTEKKTAKHLYQIGKEAYGTLHTPRK